jgi:hypothetical protein
MKEIDSEALTKRESAGAPGFFSCGGGGGGATTASRRFFSSSRSLLGVSDIDADLGGEPSAYEESPRHRHPKSALVPVTVYLIDLTCFGEDTRFLAEAREPDVGQHCPVPKVSHSVTLI